MHTVKRSITEKECELDKFYQSIDKQVDKIRRRANQDVERLQVSFYVSGYEDGKAKARPQYTVADIPAELPEEDSRRKLIARVIAWVIALVVLHS